MDLEKIITIASFVLTVLVFAWGLYQRVKGNSTAAVSGLIAMAEETNLIGKEKMRLVVEQLCEMIPGPFKATLTPEVLENIAQKIFDYMREYALAYVDSHGSVQKETYKPINDEVVNDIAQSLAKMSDVALATLAVNLGIDVKGKDSAQIIADIIVLVVGNGKKALNG